MFVKDDKVIQIEGDPDSPISRGKLCPKGAASKQLVTRPDRVTKVRYVVAPQRARLARRGRHSSAEGSWPAAENATSPVPRGSSTSR